MTLRREDLPTRGPERLLLVLSALFAVQGLVWAVLGSFDPFGLYDRWLAQALFGSTALPDAAKPVWRFGVALLGATTTGFFALFHFIVRYALAERAAWAYRALWTALWAWFLPDSAASLWVGAKFNVMAVNLPCLILIGSVLLAWRRSGEIHDRHAESQLQHQTAAPSRH